MLEAFVRHYKILIFFATGASALFRYWRLGSFFVKRYSALFSLLVTRRFFVTDDSIVIFSVTGDSLFFFLLRATRENVGYWCASVFVCFLFESGGGRLISLWPTRGKHKVPLENVAPLMP